MGALPELTNIDLIFLLYVSVLPVVYYLVDMTLPVFVLIITMKLGLGVCAL